jgi:zinc transporter ZupT
MKRALLYNFLAAVICYAGLIIGIVVGENTDANRWIFAFAGGLFIYIALVDMVCKLTHFLLYSVYNLNVLFQLVKFA